MLKSAPGSASSTDWRLNNGKPLQRGIQRIGRTGLGVKTWRNIKRFNTLNATRSSSEPPHGFGFRGTMTLARFSPRNLLLGGVTLVVVSALLFTLLWAAGGPASAQV